MLWYSKLPFPLVALLAEGVDRNFKMNPQYQDFIVALLAEGVDRNQAQQHIEQLEATSPSSRRAWIEI